MPLIFVHRDRCGREPNASFFWEGGGEGVYDYCSIIECIIIKLMSVGGKMNELKSHLFDNYLIKLLGLQIWNSIRMVDITSVGVVAFFFWSLWD